MSHDFGFEFQESSRVQNSSPPCDKPSSETTQGQSLCGPAQEAASSSGCDNDIGHHKDVGSLARMGKLTLLETKTVSSEVQMQYASYLQRFADFCKENGESWPLEFNSIDPLLADFMDTLFLEGKSPHEGEMGPRTSEVSHLEWEEVSESIQYIPISPWG